MHSPTCNKKGKKKKKSAVYFSNEALETGRNRTEKEIRSDPCIALMHSPTCKRKEEKKKTVVSVSYGVCSR